MQAIFGENEEAIKTFRAALSEARFARYLAARNNDAFKAIELYHWNAKLGQSLYITLQMWEIALRNKLNTFLSWKYNETWPFDVRCVRQLTTTEKRKLAEAISRQQQRRGIQAVPTGAIVADLSAGFWVSLLTKSYDVPFSWRYNLPRVFPYGAGVTRETAAGLCEGLLDLRNRVAHHEPIFHLPLVQRRTDLSLLLQYMCPASHAYGQAACTFDTVWNAQPQP